MLQIYCEKSQLQDGHTVLDGGCGWGSLSLCITHKYNNCKITGIWNSVTQKHILKSNASKPSKQTLSKLYNSRDKQIYLLKM
ncbi:putative S-adenosyl-L-methionine-dependent methyltransferase [Helianthus anomalus]